MQNESEGARKTGSHEELGDFSTTSRTISISALAMGIGALCAFVALALLRLIGLFTNLFYFGRWSSAMVSPVGNHLGFYSVLVPIGGALIIGVMARYGSERIRGHGIPEPIEAILINDSRVGPKVALLKQISSAISIGSGGPFGAEGPIIMVGGAVGSMVGLLAGVRSALLTLSVYAADDAFQKLPIHWMWWPAIGGLAIGLGGLIFPQAIGVGYDTIGALLQGSVRTKVILGVLLVKWFIWAVSLGSGTSGGVLAPLLMMGGALGGLEAMFLPNEGPRFLAPDQHGRHSWRHNAFSVHEHCFCL